MILLTILILILVFGLLIFVHELGHFIMAKRAGMKIEEFGFGFPPRLGGLQKIGGRWKWIWGSKHFNEEKTIYSINWIPLGGFVKILGENSADPVSSSSFNSKGAWSRFSVLIAGVTMNAVLAWLLISIVLTLGMPTLIEQGEQLSKTATVAEAKVTILAVSPDSPAANAGFKSGDSIVSLLGNEFSSIQGVQDYIASKAGQSVNITLQRGSEVVHKSIIPRVKPPQGEGALGVALGLVAKISYPWYEAIWRGILVTVSLVEQIILAFAQLIGSLFTSHSLLGSITGPVGIAALTHDAVQLGLVYLLYFTALLSINLAVINLLPIPALDGGRILFLLIEKLRRKKLNIKVESYANTVGLFLLVTLMIWVTFHDISRFSNQFANLWHKVTSLL